MRWLNLVGALLMAFTAGCAVAEGRPWVVSSCLLFMGLNLALVIQGCPSKPLDNPGPKA